jgi:hypothetical protein
MAAFFTINIIEFPHDSSNGGNGLRLGWVSKYLFGIGFAVSVPLIALAFLISETRGWVWHMKNLLGKERQHPSSRRANTQADLALPFTPPPTIDVRRSLDSEHRIIPGRKLRVGTELTGGTADSV